MASRKTTSRPGWSTARADTAWLKSHEITAGLYAIPMALRTYRCWKLGARDFTSRTIGMLGGRWSSPTELRAAIEFASLTERMEQTVAFWAPTDMPYVALKREALRLAGGDLEAFDALCKRWGAA